jgi:transposase
MHDRSSMIIINRLNAGRRAQVIAVLVDGNPIRSVVHMTGVAKNTVARLFAEVGAACSEYQNRVMRNLPCKTIQGDEIWSFVGHHIFPIRTSAPQI